MDENNQTTAACGGELPDPPAYDCPYQPGDAGYDSAERHGAYGVMHSADYEWDAVRCTAEAYGEFDSEARPGYRRKKLNGKSRRSLKFHTEWLDVETAKACIREIGSYNRFRASRVNDALDDMPDPMKVCVARESSPALYVWTLEPCEVIDAINGDEPFLGWGGGDATDDMDGCPPDELGGIPEADTFPVVTIGEHKDALDDGVPTLIRMWWD